MYRYFLPVISFDIWIVFWSIEEMLDAWIPDTKLHLRAFIRVIHLFCSAGDTFSFNLYI